MRVHLSLARRCTTTTCDVSCGLACDAVFVDTKLFLSTTPTQQPLTHPHTTPTPTHTPVTQSHRRISAGWTPPSESIHIHGAHGTLSCSSARCGPCSHLVGVFRILNIFRVFDFSRSNRSDATTHCRVPRLHGAPALDPNTFMPLRLDAYRVGHGDHLVSSHGVVLLRLLFVWRSLCFFIGTQRHICFVCGCNRSDIPQSLAVAVCTLASSL
jgi:hypothetical protein